MRFASLQSACWNRFVHLSKSVWQIQKFWADFSEGFRFPGILDCARCRQITTFGRHYALSKRRHVLVLLHSLTSLETGILHKMCIHFLAPSVYTKLGCMIKCQGRSGSGTEVFHLFIISNRAQSIQSSSICVFFGRNDFLLSTVWFAHRLGNACVSFILSLCYTFQRPKLFTVRMAMIFLFPALSTCIFSLVLSVSVHKVLLEHTPSFLLLLFCTGTPELFTFFEVYFVTRGGTVSWGTLLQDRRSPVRIPTV
jgi:hypothetical protein